MALIQFREALGQAMAEEMARDDRIFLLGEEVAQYNGAYKVSKGLLDRFGAKRVIDSPISEAGFAGLGVGAAMAGLRPIIEMMTWNFGLQGFDQIINHAAKMLYMSNGQFNIPIVFRGPNGAAHMLGSQHSQNFDAMLTNVPGMKVISPATPYDAKGLLKSAIRDNNPVIFLESEMMYALKGEVPDEEYLIPIGVGDIKRPGNDVTLIAWNKMLHVAVDAAKELEAQGIDAEVLDPRTLQPLDEALIFASVRKTHRLVIIDEGWDFAATSAQIADRVQRECFDDLDAPVVRVNSLFVPMPYAEELEAAVLPSVGRIVQAVKDVLYVGN
jgi:pyruvate dehydrogenase E1 component beta subunit